LLSEVSELEMVPVGENREERTAILVVDDNQAIGDILYEKLNSMGYHCCVVGSADDALAKLREMPFNIVLLDVKLPGKSGIDLLKDLKSSRSDTAVIIISAVVDLDTIIEAWKQQACDYIIKPFNLNQVVLSVERVLGYQHMSDVWRRMLEIRPRRSKLYHKTHSVPSHAFEARHNLTARRSRSVAGNTRPS